MDWFAKWMNRGPLALPARPPLVYRSWIIRDAVDPICRESRQHLHRSDPATLHRVSPTSIQKAQTPENGCLAVAFLASISLAEGSPFMARAIDSLVAS